LYAMLLYGMGRLEEARNHARRAYETDPYALVISIIYAYSNYLLEDYDAALNQYGKTLELRTDWTAAMSQSAIAYSHQGRHEEALAFTVRALQRGHDHSAVLADAAYVYARAGKTADARRLLREAKTSVWDAFHVGRAHVALGESDSAFVWLERSAWKWPHRAQLADPALDPIRRDPRFKDLKKRVEWSLGLR
jgi:tetratricopeptide (TPR) repeat protein